MAHSRSGSALPFAVGVLVGLALVLVLWWTLGRDSDAPEAAQAAHPAAAPAPDPAPAAAPPPAPAPATGATAPAQRIGGEGRLTVTREALREGNVLALGLELSDALRGDGERPVKVIDVTGRLLETRAVPVAEAGGGLRLEIDPEWLQPGRYMIQVETEGGAPLRVRRYVLEVLDDGGG